jgi:hypothetical protein
VGRTSAARTCTSTQLCTGSDRSTTAAGLAVCVAVARLFTVQGCRVSLTQTERARRS